jgi:hypothetical protein
MREADDLVRGWPTWNRECREQRVTSPTARTLAELFWLPVCGSSGELTRHSKRADRGRNQKLRCLAVKGGGHGKGTEKAEKGWKTEENAESQS